jgi:inner membrane protein
LGACIGEVLAGKRLGKAALLVGAVANSLPDIDFVASFWLPTTDDLLAHRGFTHSFLFLAMVSPLLAWVCGKLFVRSGFGFRSWLWFWVLQVFVHLFIDAFNAYGTAWFEPFSHYRVSFNTMFVADPLFTLWPLAGFGVVFKVFWVGKYDFLSTLFYIGMGCLSLIAIKPLLDGLSWYGFFWLAIGGLLYILGTIFYAIDKIPFNHVIWHLFVLSGSACHFLALFLYVAPV